MDVMSQQDSHTARKEAQPDSKYIGKPEGWLSEQPINHAQHISCVLCPIGSCRDHEKEIAEDQNGPKHKHGMDHVDAACSHQHLYQSKAHIV